MNWMKLLHIYLYTLLIIKYAECDSSIEISSTCINKPPTLKVEYEKKKVDQKSLVIIFDTTGTTRITFHYFFWY